MLERIKGLIEHGWAGPLSARRRERRPRGGLLLWLNRLVLLALAGFFVFRWLRERQEQAGSPVEVEEEGIQLDRFAPEMQGQQGTSEQPDEPQMAEKTISASLPSAEPQSQPAQPDDLTVIEGIGPKISSVLQEAGITTYRQLAETDVSRLQEILREASLRLADPGTWPEQARLLDGGHQEEFQKLIGGLKAGRRS